jgi:hypothetical protein
MNVTVSRLFVICGYLAVEGVYSRAPVSTDSVSAVSVFRGLPRPEKRIGKLKE